VSIGKINDIYPTAERRFLFPANRYSCPANECFHIGNVLGFSFCCSVGKRWWSFGDALPWRNHN